MIYTSICDDEHKLKCHSAPETGLKQSAMFDSGANVSQMRNEIIEFEYQPPLRCDIAFDNGIVLTRHRIHPLLLSQPPSLVFLVGTIIKEPECVMPLCLKLKTQTNNSMTTISEGWMGFRNEIAINPALNFNFAFRLCIAFFTAIVDGFKPVRPFI